MPGMNEITIYRCDSRGNVRWQYQGQVSSHKSNVIVINAFFNREDTLVQGVVIKKNDHLIETFFTDRWYNIFEIHDRDDGQIKGWYCDVGRPAVLKEKSKLYFEDLALDLWVTPDGTQEVLDEDEFVDLKLDENTRTLALAGLAEVQEYFYQRFKD
jgi:predicted RNA-binding protein associated with RNAse of E/G family